MNWKDEAVEKLRRFPVMAHAVGAIPKELELLAQEACQLQGLCGGVGGVRKVRAQENRLMDNLVRRQELEFRLEQARLWVELTEDALGQLDAQERTLLERLYIRQQDAMSVGRELGLERSTLYRNRDAALRKLTLAMYGALES